MLQLSHACTTACWLKHKPRTASRQYGMGDVEKCYRSSRIAYRTLRNLIPATQHLCAPVSTTPATPFNLDIECVILDLGCSQPPQISISRQEGVIGRETRTQSAARHAPSSVTPLASSIRLQFCWLPFCCLHNLAARPHVI